VRLHLSPVWGPVKGFCPFVKHGVVGGWGFGFFPELAIMKVWGLGPGGVLPHVFGYCTGFHFGVERPLLALINLNRVVTPF